jgi:multiple sugar transport system substrate-binding protein
VDVVKKSATVFTGLCIIAAAAAVPAIAAPKTTIRLATWDTGDGLRITKDAVNAFMKRNPAINVKIEPWGWDGYREKLLVSLSAGTAPDVFLFNEAFSGTFLYTGFLQSLGGFIKQDKMDLSGLIKSLQKIYTYKGDIYSLPKDFAPYAVYYNKTLLDQAGVQYPKSNWSWDDLAAMGKKLTKFNASGNMTLAGLNFWPGKEEIHVFLSTMNTSFMAPDDEKFAGFLDSPQTVKAIQFMADLKLKEHIAGGADFAGGKAAMSLQGPWDMAGWVKKKNFSYGIVPPPVGKQKGGCIASAAWSISTASKKKQQAWELVKFLGGPEGNRIMGQSMWAVPSWRQTIKELGIEKDPNLSQLLEASEEAISGSPIQHPFYDSVVPKYIYPTIQNNVWVGKKTAAQAISEVVGTCDKEYQRLLKTVKRLPQKK